MPPNQSRSLVRACTHAADPAVAIDELHDSLSAADPALLVLFCSSHYDLPAVAACLRARFPGVPAIGCTTSGELTPLGYMDGSITAVSFPKGDFAASIVRFDHVSRFEIGDAKPKVRDLLVEAGDAAIEMGPDARHVALFLVDGLCVKEELIISALHDALGGLPLIGGSAGDDMRFEATHVLHDGEFHIDAGVLLILTTTRPFKVFRNQHFVHTDQKMVVTQADPSRRIVTEINAEPAAREYARMVGLEGEPLTPMIFASYPVVVRVGGEYYVRSIQKVNEDESLTFFCAIDEGIVLTVATGVDIVRNLQELFDGLTAEIGRPDLILGFDCVFRSLELEQKQLKHAASRVLASQNVVGFCTYGEQFNAMHVNQTFTGLAIGAR